MDQPFTVTTHPDGGGLVVVHVGDDAHVTFTFPTVEALRAFTVALFQCGGVEVDADAPAD